MTLQESAYSRQWLVLHPEEEHAIVSWRLLSSLPLQA